MVTDHQKEIAKEAYQGLQEYHNILTEESSDEILDKVLETIQFTGDSQADYITVRDGIEAEVSRREANLFR